MAPRECDLKRRLPVCRVSLDTLDVKTFVGFHPGCDDVCRVPCVKPITIQHVGSQGRAGVRGTQIQTKVGFRKFEELSGNLFVGRGASDRTSQFPLLKEIRIFENSN